MGVLKAGSDEASDDGQSPDEHGSDNFSSDGDPSFPPSSAEDGQPSAYSYDPCTNCWLALPDPIETGRVDAVLGSIEGTLCVIGGRESFSGDLLCGAEIYDPVSQEWTALPSLSGGREDFAVAELDGKLYAIGGIDGEMEPLSVVEAYDPQKNVWTLMPSMKRGRHDHAAAALNGKLYVVGGFEGFTNEERIENCKIAEVTCEVYDPVRQVWADFASLEHGFGSPWNVSLASRDGKLWAVDSTGKTRVYDPNADLWASGPDCTADFLSVIDHTATK